MATGAPAASSRPSQSSTGSGSASPTAAPRFRARARASSRARATSRSRTWRQAACTAPPAIMDCREAEVDPALPTLVSAVWTTTRSMPSSVRATWVSTVVRPCPTSAAAVWISATGVPGPGADTSRTRPSVTRAVAESSNPSLNAVFLNPTAYPTPTRSPSPCVTFPVPPG